MQEKIIQELNLSNGESMDIANKQLSEKPRKRFEINKKDIFFALMITLASIIMAAIGIWCGFRFGYTIASVMMLITTTVYFSQKGVKINAFSIFCGILALITNINFMLTSNASVRFFSFVVSLLLSAVWIFSLSGWKFKKGDMGIITTIFGHIFKRVFVNIPMTLVSLFSGVGDRKKIFLKVIIGVSAAVPVLFIIVPLLMSSDAAFNGLAKMLVNNLAVTILKITLGSIIAVFVLSFCFSIKKCQNPETPKIERKGIDSAIVISFLSVLSFCYLAYLFSQLAYFFSAFKGFLPEDYSFTTAAYARRGFFEMSIIAAINVVMIFVALLISRKKDGKINIISRLLCTFIGIFTLIIIATAISKMVLYIQQFGMTVLRITTSSFMIFLAIVFISLIFRLFFVNIKVIQTAIITAGIVLAVLGICNVNNVVATYNYYAYKNQILKEIDIETIYKLGDEGMVYLVKLADDKDTNVAEQAREKLLYSIKRSGNYEVEITYNEYETIYEIKGKKYDGIGDYTISRSKAYKAIDKYLEKNPDLLIEDNLEEYYDKTFDYGYVEDYDYEEEFDYDDEHSYDYY